MQHLEFRNYQYVFLSHFLFKMTHSEMGMLEQFFAHHFKREVTLFGLMDI